MKQITAFMRTIIHALRDMPLTARRLRDNYRAWLDYRHYTRRLPGYERLLKTFPAASKGSLLIVSGRGMNIGWAEMWPILGLAARALGHHGLILTTRAQTRLNRYYRLLDYELLFYEDWAREVPFDLPDPLCEQVQHARSFEAFRSLCYDGAPVGEIALSTYSRYQLTGVIDMENPAARQEIENWLRIVCQAVRVAQLIYQRRQVQVVFINELFFEEYAGFYYSALKENLNIVKFTGTVRDRAFLLHHMDTHNDRLHHAALTDSTWDHVKSLPYANVEQELAQNFLDRYGGKWFRSARNHSATRMFSVSESRQRLGVSEGRKVAVIFSHILYDTLFFFGTDLFDNHADWLIETVRAACQNDRLDWLIKVHPSNVWRGEANPDSQNHYEEARLIKQAIGKLPGHVRLIPADNGINPYSWFQMADFCITVRGTAGLEMAALGKRTIVAGTGRYEHMGFTTNPGSRADYLELLSRLPDMPELPLEPATLAKRYAHALFLLKPIEFDFLTYKLRSGRRRVVASDDLAYLPAAIDGKALPGNLKRIAEWIPQRDSIEMLNL